MRFAHAEVINGIEQVGFAHSVQPGDEVEPGGKFDSLVLVIFEIGQLQFLQVHGQN
jgi:hypothetical protein